MKAIKAAVTNGIQIGTMMETCDNSGAKIVKVTAVVGAKTVKGRKPSAGVADLIQVAIKSGKQDVRKQVMFAVIVRQKKEYRRSNGMRIKFEDNSCIILKDKKGNPKGTLIKGPVAREVCERWAPIAKLAKLTV
ncbi:uL14 family ribosomal protein [Candidatus Woesearchaeota archaeon]|nr:uL14 family ribosomal protein [Candidatus Woesearchaeota archaeon]